MTEKEITIRNLKLLKESWEQQNFDPTMIFFGGIEEKRINDLDIGKVNECGTICCLLGFAPSVKGLEAILTDFNESGFSYRIYSDRIFPSLGRFLDSWRFIFGTSWPNDRIQGLKRMQYMIENDLTPPENWDYSWRG